jgi:nucleoside-triphosphatase THEP1
MKQVYLLTGRPGTGKTSLIKQVIAQMKGEAGGFYTEEIRTQGVREGFGLVTLDSEEFILAHVNIHSPYRVSKYGVDIDGLERVGIPALHKAARQCDLVIIDEIGEMELFSAKFRETVSRIINSRKRILGTIMLNPNQWADAIKRQSRVNLITVTRDNHRPVLEELLRWLKTTESPKL